MPAFHKIYKYSNKITIMKSFIIIILCFLFIPIVHGATIKGNIYDLGLNPLNGVIVTIDTMPQQVFIVTDNSYEFIVKEGNYQITANYEDDLFTSENITIVDNGTYKLDLILLPSITGIELTNFENEDMNINLNNNNLDDKSKSQFGLLFILIVIAFIALAIVFFANIFFAKKFQLEIDESTESLEDDQIMIDISKKLKDNGGSLTQKDLRKELGIGEAKLSVILTQLENDKLIEKIKKGRGNIIRLIRK